MGAFCLWPFGVLLGKWRAIKKYETNTVGCLNDGVSKEPEIYNFVGDLSSSQHLCVNFPWHLKWLAPKIKSAHEMTEAVLLKLSCFSDVHSDLFGPTAPLRHMWAGISGL